MCLVNKFLSKFDFYVNLCYTYYILGSYRSLQWRKYRMKIITLEDPTRNISQAHLVPSLEQQFLDRLNHKPASIYCSGSGFRQIGYPRQIHEGNVYMSDYSYGSITMICEDFMAIVPEVDDFDCTSEYIIVEKEECSKPHQYRAYLNLLDKPNTTIYALSGFQLKGTIRAVSPNGYLIIETHQYNDDGKTRHVLVGRRSSVRGKF